MITLMGTDLLPGVFGIVGALAELPASEERDASVRGLRTLIRHDLGSDRESH
jgi:hypothetical protein